MLQNADRREQGGDTGSNTEDGNGVILSTANILPISKSGHQARSQKRSTGNQSQGNRVRLVARYGHDRTPNGLPFNDVLTAGPIESRTENDVFVERQQGSERAPSDHKISSCNDRHQKGEPEQCKETGATEPAGPMKDRLAKDGCGERQWNVDIRQLVQIGESADQTRQNDRLGIESPVKSKSNQND